MNTITIQKDRRTAQRGGCGDAWTFLRRTYIPYPSARWWQIVIATGVLLALLVGCGNPPCPEPIYTVEGATLNNAKSWCFSKGGVDYFTIADNKPDMLFCQDGSVSDTVWN